MTNEAVALAATGKIKSHYSIRGLSELEKYLCSLFITLSYDSLIMFIVFSVYQEMLKGEIVGRVVLDLSK